MNDPNLSKYFGIFGSLHRNFNRAWGSAPHKPILLLTVLDEIERGGIPTNLILLTPELVAVFRAYWRILVPEDRWQMQIAKPFRFMIQEGFWELVKNGVPVTTQSLGANPTIRQMTTQVDGAVLDPSLWELLQNSTNIIALRAFLLKQYFGVGASHIQLTIPSNPIDYEIEKLKAEANSKFKIRAIKENQDETGYFVRHALFPNVVKQMYRDLCSICGMNVRIFEGCGLIDAAHVMPFRMFHNDNPKNGIALCKNHHWGFDAGWFTITFDYKILVSPHLQNNHNYLTSNAPILLPFELGLSPAPEALKWHNENVYLK